jgi:hypothetical protein
MHDLSQNGFCEYDFDLRETAHQERNVETIGATGRTWRKRLKKTGHGIGQNSHVPRMPYPTTRHE